MKLEELKWKKFPVLGDGHVCLVDVMGDDAAIVQAARVSYGEGTVKPSDDRTLIRYLLRHRHTTPFEMAELKLRVRVPMDAWRQWIRHRTANVNEYSTRYSEAIDSMDKTTEWRLQSGTNKQGSTGFVTDWPEGWSVNEIDGRHIVFDADNKVVYETNKLNITPQECLSKVEDIHHQNARKLYEDRLKFGVAREQARKDLPLSTYTEAYWKIDLHNLFHFLSLRMDSHAQKEIRDYANVIGNEIVSKLFPVAWEAFVDYRLNGMFLTGLEVAMIKKIMDEVAGQVILEDVEPAYPEDWQDKKRCRERDEALAKLGRLGFLSQDDAP